MTVVSPPRLAVSILRSFHIFDQALLPIQSLVWNQAPNIIVEAFYVIRSVCRLPAADNPDFVVVTEGHGLLNYLE